MDKELWALILGGSSGLGLATAKRLAQDGYSIFVVHRDRKADLEEIDRHFQEIASRGVGFENFNTDAVQKDRREALLRQISESLGSAKIKVLVHSIAKGNLKPMYSESGGTLSGEDFAFTIEAMATSVYDWAKGLTEKNLFADDSRIISFTSEGSSKPWPGYAAISAAKATIEAITRSMALEFAPLGIKANCIQAGVTDTKSFQAIPGSEKLKSAALRRNPNGRLTTPEDVANVVSLLCQDEAKWITGTVIKVDGGESLR